MVVLKSRVLPGDEIIRMLVKASREQGAEEKPENPSQKLRSPFSPAYFGKI